MALSNGRKKYRSMIIGELLFLSSFLGGKQSTDFARGLASEIPIAIT